MSRGQMVKHVMSPYIDRMTLRVPFTAGAVGDSVAVNVLVPASPCRAGRPARLHCPLDLIVVIDHDDLSAVALGELNVDHTGAAFRGCLGRSTKQAPPSVRPPAPGLSLHGRIRLGSGADWWLRCIYGCACPSWWPNGSVHPPGSP